MPKFTVYLTDIKEHSVRTHTEGLIGRDPAANEFFSSREDIDLHEVGAIVGHHQFQIDGEWEDEDALIADIVTNLDGYEIREGGIEQHDEEED